MIGAVWLVLYLLMQISFNHSVLCNLNVLYFTIRCLITRTITKLFKKNSRYLSNTTLQYHPVLHTFKVRRSFVTVHGWCHGLMLNAGMCTTRAVHNLLYYVQNLFLWLHIVLRCTEYLRRSAPCDSTQSYDVLTHSTGWLSGPCTVWDQASSHSLL